jgi:UDP-glucuronate decarboxylase
MVYWLTVGYETIRKISENYYRDVCLSHESFESNQMRILVTGGAGFLGSHLCEKLISLNHEVIALDNFYTGEKWKVQELADNDKFELVRQDVTTPLNFEVDAVMNLACPASPVHYQKFPVQTIKTSVLGAMNVLDLATKLNVPVFQASTSEVYGDPTISPQDESYWGSVNPIGIRACYDEGKRSSETLFFDFHRQFGTAIKVARIFNTYGPRMSLNDGRVVSNFIVQALNNEPISIYGDGTQTRSFCYVSDLIDGIIQLMFSGPDITGPVNLGNPVEFTMLELAEKVIKLTNSNSKISFHELPQDDPKQRKPDISKAKHLLNWEPTVELSEGLKRTINEFSTRI